MTARKGIVSLLIPCFALMVFGCAGSQEAKTDTRDADLAAIRKADEAWSATVTSKDWEGSYGTLASDAIMLAPHAPIAEGYDASRKIMEDMAALPGFALSWQATSVEVSSSGDLGYTIGTYELSFTGPDGETVVDKGKYATIWKKQADGTWKVAVDMFNTNLPLPTGEDEG
ncbi:MAG: DUF4440 domain-containing protein [candidate division Zixibacteria bacterium]|nr:DUF4440 domain-containing protein [candidate division Zixibacteria bacterium]